MVNPRRPRSALRLRDFQKFMPPRNAVSALIEDFFHSLDGDEARICLELYKSKDFDQLVKREIDPLRYTDPLKFRDDFAAISFLRKSSFLRTTIDKRAVALETFRAAEEQCKETNSRFRDLALDPMFNGPNVWLLNALRSKIAMILRDSELTPEFVEEIFDSGAFGPGASTSITGDNTSTDRKFREERQITAALYRVVGPFLADAYPLWFKEGKLSEVEIRNFSKVITVPKSAKTDRVIAVEPGLNIWFQKAFGSMIRRRLGKHGLNLDRADEVNGRLARYASITGKLATVDFSSASDTISKEMVREIIPWPWNSLLDCTRSACYELDTVMGTFEKFSSMGNGFTFELESLIFYAAALVCCEYTGGSGFFVSVFGDDVILPVESYELYVNFCSFLGFTVNKRKSFSSGKFRESCGRYYFDGLDVKPFFFKKDLKSASSIINYCNAIRDLAHSRNSGTGCDVKFKDCYDRAVLILPEHLRVKGDRRGGMGCIHSNFDECTPTKAKNQLEGYLFECLIFPAVTVESDHPSLLLARLVGSSDREYRNSVSLRSVTKLRKTRMFVHQWYNFGPWE